MCSIVCQVAISQVLKVCPQEKKHHVPLEDLIYSPGIILSMRDQEWVHTSVCSLTHSTGGCNNEEKIPFFWWHQLKDDQEQSFPNLLLMACPKVCCNTSFLKRIFPVMSPHYIPVLYITMIVRQHYLHFVFTYEETEVQCTQLVSEPGFQPHPLCPLASF